MAWSQVSNIKGPTGTQGAQGPQGNPGATGQGYNWKGAWSAATAYVAYDTVSNGGSTYVCILANTNQAPPNVTYWSLMAQQGSQGPAGSTGSQGPPGSTGSTGPGGTRGSLWYSGSGAPGTISGQLVNDLYLDIASGNVWQLS
jgi:hypothetical protein